MSRAHHILKVTAPDLCSTKYGGCTNSISWLQVCWRYRISGPTQNVLNWNLYFRTESPKDECVCWSQKHHRGRELSSVYKRVTCTVCISLRTGNEGNNLCTVWIGTWYLDCFLCPLCRRWPLSESTGHGCRGNDKIYTVKFFILSEFCNVFH